MAGVECGEISATSGAPSPRGEVRDGVRRGSGDGRENRGERL